QVRFVAHPSQPTVGLPPGQGVRLVLTRIGLVARNLLVPVGEFLPQPGHSLPPPAASLLGIQPVSITVSLTGPGGAASGKRARTTPAPVRSGLREFWPLCARLGEQTGHGGEPALIV